MDGSTLYYLLIPNSPLFDRVLGYCAGMKGGALLLKSILAEFGSIYFGPDVDTAPV